MEMKRVKEILWLSLAMQAILILCIPLVLLVFWQINGGIEWGILWRALLITDEVVIILAIVTVLISPMPRQ